MIVSAYVMRTPSSRSTPNGKTSRLAKVEDASAGARIGIRTGGVVVR